MTALPSRPVVRILTDELVETLRAEGPSFSVGYLNSLVAELAGRVPGGDEILRSHLKALRK